MIQFIFFILCCDDDGHKESCLWRDSAHKDQRWPSLSPDTMCDAHQFNLMEADHCMVACNPYSDAIVYISDREERAHIPRHQDVAHSTSCNCCPGVFGCCG